MSKNKKNQNHPSAQAYLTNPVASAQDCTGFVPVPPEIEAQAKAYSGLMNVPVTKSPKKKKNTDKHK